MAPPFIMVSFVTIVYTVLAFTFLTFAFLAFKFLTFTFFTHIAGFSFEEGGLVVVAICLMGRAVRSIPWRLGFATVSLSLHGAMVCCTASPWHVSSGWQSVSSAVVVLTKVDQTTHAPGFAEAGLTEMPFSIGSLLITALVNICKRTSLGCGWTCIYSVPVT
ncbi:hypothetical protein K431DRAFT_101158 [Polychaeton citri CBS 116435]|uniref:Transmembrane protein n=1 Tax=Polychaeton citri CBS 116435 TaxID=1314669 RepID=A0A9P4QGH0_9PEZI|nr:hypothetical protein K431DRAFT_101158 [Polychaeton citri CBS 116435]